MIFDMASLIYRRKNIITSEEANYVIEEYNKYEKQSTYENSIHAVTGLRTESSFKCVTLSENCEAYKIIFNATEKLINEYVDYLDSFKMFYCHLKYFMNYSHSLRVLKYEVGSKIHPHTDFSPFIFSSATINLNDSYTGGDFVFWNGKHRVKLEANEGIIWPADFFWIHEVEKVTEGVRYASNSFIQNIPNPLKKEILSELSERLEQYQYNLKNIEYDKKHRYKIK